MNDRWPDLSWLVPGRRVKEIEPGRGRAVSAAGHVLFVGGLGYSPDDVRLQTDTGRVVLRKIHELEGDESL